MIQVPFTKPDRYIKCPGCSGGFYGVSHLTPGCKTAWYCDECGVRFRLHVISADEVDCDVMPGERTDKTRVTLRSEGPVTIVVQGCHQTSADGREFGEGDEYFYNEHTCPANYLGVLKVIAPDGDGDPHGIFKYVKTEPWKTE